VPVPDCGVYEDLAGGELAGALQLNQRDDQGADAEDEVDGVGDGDEVEEVAAAVGMVKDVLRG